MHTPGDWESIFLHRFDPLANSSSATVQQAAPSPASDGPREPDCRVDVTINATAEPKSAPTNSTALMRLKMPKDHGVVIHPIDAGVN